jgi:hypothetical protein
MIDRDSIAELVAQWTTPRHVGDYLIVPTFATYPSSSLVQVFISGGKDRFVVSDGGGAIRVLLGAGDLSGGGRRFLSGFIKGTDVRVNESGWMYLPTVTFDRLTSAISIVAEMSRDAAVALLKHFKPAINLDFRRDLAVTLDKRFHDTIQRKGHLLGASNKVHTFDYVIRANDNALLALDAVVNDASSVNAAVVAHMDVRAMHRSDLKQIIVYDDNEAWKASDLALLTVGAPAVAFSRFSNALDRIVSVADRV